MTDDHIPAFENGTEVAYGIDIGGTKIEVGIFTYPRGNLSELQLLNRKRLETPTRDYSQFIETLVTAIREADDWIAHMGGTTREMDTWSGRPASIGIGMPGIIDNNGCSISANIPCATGCNVKQDLSAALGRSVALGNDCRLFALSESQGGEGAGYAHVYGAIIGTGVAGGFCIDGNLYEGRNGVAGEYGHLPVSAHLIQRYNLPVFPCGCGLTGCYESYVSGPALGRIYRHFGADNNDTYHFTRKLREGEETARRAFACYLDFLGASFTSIIMSYDPDVIVLGGGMSRVGEVVTALPQAISAHLFCGVECPSVVAARFGDASGVRGAAILGGQFIAE